MKALLSVYEKAGIVDLATELAGLGIDLISSGGTAQVIAEAGLEVTDVAELTGFAPMLGHRVVTLHPRVHGAILADRRNTDHLRDLEEHQLDLIDIVVGNLYPFSSDPSIELIDIGGPAMLRAAAKNHEYVTVLVDPGDYGDVLDELAQAGSTSAGLRRRLAAKAFAHTAGYDAEIANWFSSSENADGEDAWPTSHHLSLERFQDLRYGENPHQGGAHFQPVGRPSWWTSVEQLNGSDLSYLNVFDADAAWALAHDLGDEPTVAIIKHANPCGVATANDLASAYSQAYDCDTRSAFGGIVACNRVIDGATAEAIEQAAQADLIIAPGFGPGVVERLAAKRKSTRVLQAAPPVSSGLQLRSLTDSYLLQDEAGFVATADEWTVVTERQPTDAEMVDASFAWRVCGHVTSNAIVLAKDRVAWGIGAGQQNRVESGQLAATKADGRAEGGACASDAFYPFPDGIEAAADAGVSVVIQPGGSVNDSDVIAAANKLGLAMIFTGERQFRH